VSGRLRGRKDVAGADRRAVGRHGGGDARPMELARAPDGVEGPGALHEDLPVAVPGMAWRATGLRAVTLLAAAACRLAAFLAARGQAFIVRTD
jgi:hypothetical protein